MFSFEKLNVYKEALGFINEIYTTTEKFPKGEMFGLTSQLQRAAVSISLNIAEGSSRTKKDFSHFLDISRGSCYECVAILSIANKRSYINKIQFDNLYDYCVRLSKMISGLKNSIV